MMFYLLLRVYNIQYLVIFIMMTRVFLHHPAKDVADAKLVIEMRKEAHSLVEERRQRRWANARANAWRQDSTTPKLDGAKTRADVVVQRMA